MSKLNARLLPAILALALGLSISRGAEESGADVIVYGGTSGGVTAAVQAARMGKSVILIEPGRHLGGMTSSGLGLTDTGGRKNTIGGLSREFYRNIYVYYQKPEAWKYDKRDEYLSWLPKGWADTTARSDDEKVMYVFEPHVAEQVYNDMIKAAGPKLEVVYGERLDLKNGVAKDGTAIRSITMESGRKFNGKMFIDATYEGDLMAKSGVKYIVGREANAKYGEKFNGVLPSGALAFPKVDPYVEPGKPESGLLPRVNPKPPGIPGEGDDKNQAYNFRLCLTKVPENRIPFVKPEHYDPKDYELLARWIATMPPFAPGASAQGEIALRGNEKDLALSFHRMPNRKTDCNSGTEFGTDYYGKSYTWADAGYDERQKIWDDHKNYIQGLLWFLSTDERLPEPVRKEMQLWGLPKDEFTDCGNWPFQLYVREARRMVSDYVVTEHDARGEQVAPDSVAIACYSMDSHGVSLFIDADGHLAREKGIYQKSTPFPISYRAICPSADQCTNLLVPVCVSASHVGYAPIRMEPVFMMLGQSAATAACLAIDADAAVQKVPYDDLRRKLLADKQVLDVVNKGGAPAAAADTPPAP